MNNVVVLSCLLILLSACLQISGLPMVPASDDFEGRRKSLEKLPKWIMFLLRECVGQLGTGRQPLILAGNFAEEITAEIHISAVTTVVLFNESNTRLDEAYAAALKRPRDFYDKHLFRYQSRAGIFIVAARSQTLMRNLFERLKLSIWWNHLGLFFITDEEVEERGCRNAFPFLWTVWQNGILSAVYFCREKSTASLNLYSFNPFTDRAQFKSGWKISAVYSGDDGHPWTMFRMKIAPENLTGEKGRATINRDAIFFDKISRDLNGYIVRVNLMEIFPSMILSSNESTPSSRIEKKYFGTDGWMAQALWGALNATLVEVPYEGDLGMGFTDEEGTHVGMKGDIATEKVDMGLNQRLFGQNLNLETTYPHFVSSYCFLSKSKTFYPLWESIVIEFDPWIILLTLGALLASNLVLKRLENRSPLRLFRFLSCDGMRSKPPFELRAKILFLGTCGLIGITNSLFQGKVSALVTKPRRFADINTLEELIESGYEIHGYLGYQNFIKNSKIRANFFSSGYMHRECFKKASIDMPITCAAECPTLSIQAANHSGLHIANEPIFTRYSQHVARINWPIIREVDAIIWSLVSAGLPDYWTKKSIYNLIGYNKYQNLFTFSKEAEPLLIQLHDLSNILYFILTGFLLAILIFFIEIVHFRWFKNNRCFNYLR